MEVYNRGVHGSSGVCMLTGASVVELEVLVGEHHAAVDGFGAGSVAVGEIASLDHESRDDPVERGRLVPERLPVPVNSFLPCVWCYSSVSKRIFTEYLQMLLKFLFREYCSDCLEKIIMIRKHTCAKGSEILCTKVFF